MAKRYATALLVTGLVSLATCAGCRAMAATWTVFFPKETVPAEFELPPAKKVLVFPDDMFSPLSYPPAKRSLAKKLNDILAEKKLAADLIPYDELRDLAADDADFNKLEVATVGRKLGADLVIYIVLDPLMLKDAPEDSLWHGRFGGRVRVVDVRKGRIWPEESVGRQVSIVEQPADNASETYGEKLALTLGAKLGEKIGFLFAEHKEEIMRQPVPKFDPLE